MPPIGPAALAMFLGTARKWPAKRASHPQSSTKQTNHTNEVRRRAQVAGMCMVSSASAENPQIAASSQDATLPCQLRFVWFVWFVVGFRASPANLVTTTREVQGDKGGA